MKRTWLSLAVLTMVLVPEVVLAADMLVCPPAQTNPSKPAWPQITRVQSVTNGRQFARHRWSAKEININPTRCPSGFDWHSSAGVQTYQQVSYHYVGDFIGLPYNWGGRMTPSAFDQKIADGYGAGVTASTRIEDPDCTAGVDCSGFVSTAWFAGPKGTSYYTTAAIPDVTTSISLNQMRAGDVWNYAGYHVAMFTQTLSNGVPEAVESIGYNVNINRNGGYGNVQGFSPRRYPCITGDDSGVTTLPGTTESPTAIQPNGTVSVNTAASKQSTYSVYGCSSSNQSGPEVVHVVTFDSPGTFTASLSDDGNADLDVHILSQLNTNACIARDDRSATAQVGCGTYYVIVDTYNGDANKGIADLTTTFTPSGAACGSPSGPAAFTPKGRAGAECNDTVWCDVNQGGDACLRTSDQGGFCSKPCETNADCADMEGGAGCCGEVTVGSGSQQRTEHYCYVASYCQNGEATSSGGVSTSGGNGTSGGSSGRRSSSGASGDTGDDDVGDDDSGDDDDDGSNGGGKGKNNADGSDSSGGCSAIPGGSGASSMLLLGALGLTALAARRRRK